jgi:hypothetical protein
MLLVGEQFVALWKYSTHVGIVNPELDYDI